VKVLFFDDLRPILASRGLLFAFLDLPSVLSVTRPQTIDQNRKEV
jgi:hypothetical protein